MSNYWDTCPNWQAPPPKIAFREMWSTTLKSIMLALAPFYFHKILKEELEMEKSIIDRRK